MPYECQLTFVDLEWNETTRRHYCGLPKQAYDIEVHSEKALFEGDAINYKISLSFHFSRIRNKLEER